MSDKTPVLGLVGLGRMGANMVRRLERQGVPVACFDVSAEARDAVRGEATLVCDSLEAVVGALTGPRALWLMLPVQFVESVIEELLPNLSKGDSLIDGGNSHYVHDLRRADELGQKGIDYLDVGVSGGVFGLERGYCLMIGGPDAAVARLNPVFEALAPGVEAAPRTPGRDGDPTPEERGYLHCGPAGAGHFVKMVHNGIEYGAMAAFAEGLNLMRHANDGARERAQDAETAPLEHPERFRFDLDLEAITEVWRRGSVVSSWLLDLTAQALHLDPNLAEFKGQVSDSGEGRWTVQAAIEAGVPAHVLSAALFDRFESRGQADFANKVLSAMRKGFGGHLEK
ncbi:MAG: phosphogluconate dehydrogenase (NAD(+)-dependent, decarboxylating) [Planctomycetota bacterium]